MLYVAAINYEILIYNSNWQSVVLLILKLIYIVRLLTARGKNNCEKDYYILHFRIERMARDIVEDMSKSKKRIIALCVLKGGFRFFSDLNTKIQLISQNSETSLPMSIDFIRLKSYEVSCLWYRYAIQCCLENC